jgi:hypothetical protein
MTDQPDQIEIDEPSATVDADDRRRRIEEPPPVRIIAVDDCYLWAPAGLERQLDEFYEELLNFERLQFQPEHGPDRLSYRAENFKLHIEVVERPLARVDYRPLILAVQSLNDLASRLTESEIEFVRERGLTPGHDQLFLLDPAGNPVAIGEYRIAI